MRKPLIALVIFAAGCAPPDEPLYGFSSNLPLVLIDTRGVDVDADELWEADGSRAWSPVSAVFIDIGAGGRAGVGDEPDWSGLGGMHVRGNSSTDYEKKQYAFETWDADGEDIDVALLGLPAEEDWVLHGPFSDKTLMRNHLIYTWSRDIGCYASRTRFVELFVDDDANGMGWGDYRGVYVLMEKIKRDANRVDIDALAPSIDMEPEISGGYLLKRDWYDPEDTEAYLVTATYEDALVLVHPKPKEITAAQRSWIQAYLDGFEAVLESPSFADPVAGYASYIDVDSFIDHHILVELARNVDGYVLSTFIYKERDGGLFMGPIWDFNGSLGNADYFQAWDPEGWHFENPDFPGDNPNGYRWYRRLFADPVFRGRYRARWEELRAGPLATDVLLARIDTETDVLTEAADRNFDRWDILGRYVWPNDAGFEERESFAAEVAYLRDWLERRVTWLDGAVIVLAP